MATRQLKITGSIAAEPAAATILVNGAQVFAGPLAPGADLETDVDLATVDFAQLDPTAYETVSVTITVTTGIARISAFYVNNRNPEAGDKEIKAWLIPQGVDPTNPGPWLEPWPAGWDGPDDGRINILINGELPDWPATPVDPMPGGTPENPDWTYWFFEVSAGETFTCDYNVLPYTRPP